MQFTTHIFNNKKTDIQMLKLPTIILLCIFLAADSIFCQFDVLDKVKKKVEEKIDESTKEKKDEEKKDEEEQKESTETEKTEVNQKGVEKTELKSYSKFDFVPGTT
jgi:Ran GTPase-activating protein (RanGAP) involved in mRNA processing and transport